MQKEDSIKYRGTQFNEKTNLLSDYIQLNLLAFQYLRNRNYNSAKKSFKECINIAKQFNEFDESKHLESLVNYAISQYFCGKFIDAFSSLERAYQISSRIITSIIKDKNTINLHIRILSNISLIALSLNKISDCRNYFNQIIDIIEKEKSIFNKIVLFKEVIYIFFRIESLNNFYEENIANKEILNKDSNSKPEPNEIILTKNNNNSNFNNEKLKKDLNDLDEDEQLRKNISKTLLSLHKFLRDNDIETWIRCLIEESTYFKGIKDVNGYVFTIINQYAANYYQTGKIGDFKTIYQTIINNYGERAKEKNKDKSPEKILIEMKSRIELAIDIYRKLVETENELFYLFDNKNSESGGKNKMIINAINLNNNLANTNKEKENIINDNKNQSYNDEIVFKNYDKEKNKTSKNQNNNININIKENENLDERNSNKFLIKLFFKHALYQLNKDTNINYKDKNVINENQTEKNNLNDPGEESNNYKSSIRSQIELALKLLENDEFDVSSINIFNINSEVTKSLRILFENIKMIRNKKEMQKIFKNWKLRVLGYDKLSEHMNQKYIKNDAYFKSLLEEIKKGDEITKIHYSSNGKIVHFYQIDSSTLTLRVYKNLSAKNTNSKFKSINLTDVKEILYGQSSENLVKRFKNLLNKEFKEPWLFLSIILTKRSIDLYFDSQEKLNKWFYGFKYLIEEKKLNIKIKTTFDFVFTRTKLRLIKELRDYNENNKGKQNKSIEVLNQLREYSLINLFGFDSLSVLKIILLYYKVMKVSV